MNTYCCLLMHKIMRVSLPHAPRQGAKFALRAGHIPRNLVKFALNSDLCLFDRFRPKINMGGDREVVVIMQLSICTSHTIFVNPIRVKPQNFTILTQKKLVPGGYM